ncbi:putative membrane protein [Nakamurella sp. UYEF19]|uniref:DUF998 domain-containing protein n=1 Tax=Nakamurella sp. UYEF19 TaxID=1756392 RepID=UPI0033966CA8
MEQDHASTGFSHRGEAQQRRVVESLSVDLLEDEAHAPSRDIVLARRLAVIGIAGVLVSFAAIALLHVMAPSRSLDPLSRTISEYALLPNGWIFDWSVVLLAVSSVIVLVAMVLREMVDARSWGAVMTIVWSIGLVGLVVFPKQGMGPDPSVAGRVHWTWTLIAFFSLPIGAYLMARRHRVIAGRWPTWAVRLSMVSAGWFLVLAGQTVLSAVSPIEAWRVVGLVERALSLTEMAVVVMLGLWVIHDSKPPAVPS